MDLNLKMCWSPRVSIFTSPSAVWLISVPDYAASDLACRWRLYWQCATDYPASSREVVLLVYSRTVRLAEKRGVNRAMLSRIPRHQAVGMPFSSRV